MIYKLFKTWKIPKTNIWIKINILFDIDIQLVRDVNKFAIKKSHKSRSISIVFSFTFFFNFEIPLSRFMLNRKFFRLKTRSFSQIITQNQNNNAKFNTISQRRLEDTIVEKNKEKINEISQNNLNSKYNDDVIFT